MKSFSNAGNAPSADPAPPASSSSSRSSLLSGLDAIRALNIKQTPNQVPREDDDKSPSPPSSPLNFVEKETEDIIDALNRSIEEAEAGADAEGDTAVLADAPTPRSSHADDANAPQEIGAGTAEAAADSDPPCQAPATPPSATAQAPSFSGDDYGAEIENDADDERESPAKVTHLASKKKHEPAEELEVAKTPLVNDNEELVRITHVAKRYREEHEALRFFADVLKQENKEKATKVQEAELRGQRNLLVLRKNHEQQIEQMRLEYSETEKVITALTGQLKAGLSQAIAKNKALEQELADEREARKILEEAIAEQFSSAE